MGFLEGAVVVAAAIVLARLFPLVGEDVTYKTVCKKLPAAKERELEELEQELCDVRQTASSTPFIYTDSVRRACGRALTCHGC